MTAAEDFTFPVISSNNAAVNLSLLPPLWRISDSDQTSAAAIQRRPFASQIIKIDDAAEGAEAEAESQEKMDLLWEDFNEESADNDSSDSEFSEETSQHPSNNNCGRDGSEECANVRQLKLIRAKPKKMESLVKVMKKLFSLHSNQQKSNQR